MKYLLFAVYDVKTLTYSAPYLARTNGDAIRAFQTACNDSGSQFNLYPEDYSLNCIGGFDETTAELISHAARPVANATEFKKKEI